MDHISANLAFGGREKNIWWYKKLQGGNKPIRKTEKKVATFFFFFFFFWRRQNFCGGRQKNQRGAPNGNVMPLLRAHVTGGGASGAIAPCNCKRHGNFAKKLWFFKYKFYFLSLTTILKERVVQTRRRSVKRFGSLSLLAHHKDVVDEMAMTNRPTHPKRTINAL